MKFVTSLLTVAPLLASTLAQRPANETICDYYTTALLTNNTAANQYTLLTLVVNTAVIGNYTKPNVGIKVAGILAPGTINGTAVNLLPYFNGGFASSNRGNSSGVAINFLDGGGAAPLLMNLPANDTTSNQYKLLTHLYQYFGALLGCGAMGYPAYAGQASQYNVHKFMDLNYYENTYFIEQVGLAAASFGVAAADVQYVGTALSSLFNYRCAPPTTIIPAQGEQLQAICIADNCMLAANATCAAYAVATMPAVANATLVGNTTTNATATSSRSGTSMSGTAAATSASAAATSAKSDAKKIGFGAGAGLLSLVAFLL